MVRSWCGSRRSDRDVGCGFWGEYGGVMDQSMMMGEWGSMGEDMVFGVSGDQWMICGVKSCDVLWRAGFVMWRQSAHNFRVSHKSVSQECLPRMSYQDVAQGRVLRRDRPNEPSFWSNASNKKLIQRRQHLGSGALSLFVCSGPAPFFTASTFTGRFFTKQYFTRKMNTAYSPGWGYYLVSSTSSDIVGQPWWLLQWIVNCLEV